MYDAAKLLQVIAQAGAVLDGAGLSRALWSPSDVLLIIQHESGGNPWAINLRDTNALRGDPSRGLMQVIGSTFTRYALPGYDTQIYDPVSNVIAGIRYAVATYGSTGNVPGVVAVQGGGQYVGY